MRFIVLLILVSVFMLGCSPNDNGIIDPDEYLAVISSCTATQSIKDDYWDDAERLTLRIIQNDPSNPWNDSVRIDRAMAGGILQGLLGVHNGFEMPYRDSVIAIYGIHTFEDIVLDRLLVKVDESFNWVQQWKLGNQITGNNDIDALMDKYNLTLDGYNQWTIGNFALVKSGESLNQAALAREFEAVSGVYNAQVDAVTGDGNDITYTNFPNDGYQEFIYSVGYGDCPSSCTKRRFFRFYVTNDCRLEFWGSWGDPAP